MKDVENAQLKKNIAELQKQLQNAYKRIAELMDENVKIREQLENESI
jgi:regulator of replication initiation timing